MSEHTLPLPNRPFRLIVVSSIGCYRSTIAEKLAEHFQANIFDLGKRYRQIIQHEPGPLADQIAAAIDFGHIAPKAAMLQVAPAELQRLWDDPKPLIVPNFPKTLEQAEVMIDLSLEPTHVAQLSRPERDIIRDLTARRVCAVCGETFQLGWQGTTEQTTHHGQPLVQRKDDTLEFIEHRLRRDANDLAQLLPWMHDHWPAVPWRQLEVTTSAEMTKNIAHWLAEM